MNFVVIDWETFFCSASGYTLKKMTTEEYIRDPRFEAHGCAIKWSPDRPAKWYSRREIPVNLDWSKCCVIHHHAHFDSAIESIHYGIKPGAIACTLSMARLLLGNHVKVSLDSVRAHFGLPSKITPYHLFDGKHWDEMPPEHQHEIAAGACDEVESIWHIFCELAKEFPREEYQVVDTTVRMFTEPVCEGDVPHLGAVWTAEAKRRAELLQQVGLTAKDLRSDENFANLLRAEGVEPPTKQGKNGPIYAFAKTDRFLKELPEHENPRVAALGDARLGTKTSILQSRAERMATMAQRGPLCIYINYAGAHTSRFSGGDKLNFQNPPPVLKKAIKAPPGHKLGIADASQIECRILNMLAGQMDVIERFRNGEDPYVNVASAFYGYEVNKKDHPEQRQCGKVIELQCGFGSGGPKIKETIRIKAGILLTDEQGMAARDAYRNTHPNVVDLWRQAEGVLDRLHNFESSDWGCLRIRCDRERGRRRIVLPNGIQLIYDTLEWYHAHDDDGLLNGERYWRIRTREGYAKLYGAKLVENIVQALARVVVTQAMNRIKAQGIRIATMTHDDVVTVLLDDANIHDKFEIVKAEMRRTPDWLPGIPLDCEGVLSERYEK